MTIHPAQVVDAPLYSSELGEFLPSKAARLAEILHDYNPYLEDLRKTEREIEDPGAILAWLFEGDLSKHGFSDIVARSKAKEAAEQLLQHKREAEIAEERQELASAIISGGRNKLNSFRHNGKIFTDAGGRRVSQTVH